MQRHVVAPCGGSEVYVETIARALAAGGNDVTLHAALFPGARREERVEGVRLVRGGSKLSVYPAALRALRRGDLGRPDVVVDVQNGVPFASPLVTRAPTVVLVHHVHREQWPVVYGPVRARIGWLLESRMGPRIYRHCRYVAVSEATRRELAALDVESDRVAVVPNGVHGPAAAVGHRSPTPHVVVLGRLVPHKQVEHALRAVATLRDSMPDLTMSVVGDGWWRSEVVAEAARLGIAHRVTFHGFLPDTAKRAELRRAWVMALPSLKEGWGLVVTEAAAHGVPTVAYRSAGGVTESVRDGVSGLLVDGGEAAFGEALRSVLLDEELRRRLARGATEHAGQLSWQATADGFAQVLSRAIGRPVPVGRVTAGAALHDGSRHADHSTGLSRTDMSLELAEHAAIEQTGQGPTAA